MGRLVQKGQVVHGHYDRCPAGGRDDGRAVDHVDRARDPLHRRERGAAPGLVEGEARQRQMTLSDLLLENRIVFLGASPEVQFAEINDLSASLVIQKLLFLQYENKNQEINMYINCPGGSVSSTLAIYDTMQFLECPINTYCMGMAASGAALILTAGTKGKRFALPHSKVMIQIGRASWRERV